MSDVDRETQDAPDEAPVADWTERDRRTAALVAARVSRLSPDRTVARLRAEGAPEGDVQAVHHALVADLAWRARAIDVDRWVCACGEPYATNCPPPTADGKPRRGLLPLPKTGYPRDACSCGREYPRRCVTPGCARVVEPREIETVGDRLALAPSRMPALVAVSADGVCGSCATDAPYRARLRAWAGSSVPAEERGLASATYWDGHEGRPPVVEAVNRWLDADLGREIGPCALYLWGERGRGKTVSAARAVYLALVERALVGSVVWTTQAQLRTWHDQRWMRDTDRQRALADQASQAWQRCRDAHLLVVDDVGTGGARGAFAEQLGDLVRERLDGRQPSIYTANLRPGWSAWLESDGRIDSRWQARGLSVEVLGQDWRAQR